MERNFINFNGSLINTRYIKKLIVKRKQRKEIKLIIKYSKVANRYDLKCVNNGKYIGMCHAFHHASLNDRYYNKHITYRLIYYGMDRNNSRKL